MGPTVHQLLEIYRSNPSIPIGSVWQLFAFWHKHVYLVEFFKDTAGRIGFILQ